MRSALAIGVVLGVGSATALAGPIGAAPDDTREGALVEPVPLTLDDVGLRWRAELQGAAMLGGRDLGGLATATAEVAVTGPGCDPLVAGGQLELRSDARVLAAQQWVTACPLGGDGHVSLDHRLAWDVAPRLLAAPRLRPGLQRRETLGFEVFGAPKRELAPDPFDTWETGPLRLELTLGWLAGEGPSSAEVMFHLRLFTFGTDQPDGSLVEIGLGGFSMRVVETDGGTVGAAGLDLARVKNWRVAGLRLGATLETQLAFASVGEGVEQEEATVLVTGGDVSAEGDLARGWSARVIAERRGWAAWDGRFVVDDRATASVSGARGRVRGRLDLTIASSALVDARAGRRDVTSGGLTAAAEIELGAHATLRGRAEAGRSPYAPGATPDAPVWAVESMLLLAVHAGSP